MVALTPLTGEPLALDLVNTRPRPQGRPVDLIGSLKQLRAWLTLEEECLPGFSAEDAEQLTTGDVALVHAVRDHTATIIERVRHGSLPPFHALEGLNAAMQAAPSVRTITLEGDTIQLAFVRDGPPGLRLAACLADAAADLASDPACRRIRECEAEDCTMLFVPTHPRRRWCSSARCGNRTRVARYYRRNKAG